MPQVLYALIPIGISCAAFAFSVFTWRERKVKDQRDLFLRVHERLVDVDLQRGRRIIYQDVNSVQDVQHLMRERPGDYDTANRALAVLDIAALYVERGYLDEQLFMQEWGLEYANILKHAQYFIDERASQAVASADKTWPHLQFLGARATRHLAGHDSLGQETGD